MKIKDGFVLREIGGKFFAVPVGERSRDFHAMISLNGTAKDMWEHLQSETDEAAIVKAIADKYEADEAEVLADVKAFVASLRKADLILE